MGYPGLVDLRYIADNCTGQFVRHHTIAKEGPKRSAEIAILQGISDIARKELLGHKKTYFVQENKEEQEGL
jgi:hypothetical protein